MVKNLTFEEWKKCAVHVSDARPFASYLPEEFDGPSAFRDARPMVLYLVPIDELNSVFVLCGYMKRAEWSSTCQRWHVDVSNIEKQFDYFDEAQRWLWENYARAECNGGGEDGTMYHIFAIDNDGNEVFNRAIMGFEHVMSQVYKIVGDEPEDRAEALKDLSVVGKRFHETRHGHIAVFPLEI